MTSIFTNSKLTYKIFLCVYVCLNKFEKNERKSRRADVQNSHKCWVIRNRIVISLQQKSILQVTCVNVEKIVTNPA